MRQGICRACRNNVLPAEISQNLWRRRHCTWVQTRKVGQAALVTAMSRLRYAPHCKAPVSGRLRKSVEIRSPHAASSGGFHEPGLVGVKFAC